MQNLFTFLKVAGLVGLVGVAAFLRTGSAAHFLPLLPHDFKLGLLGAVGAAMVSTLFAYDGWHFVGYVGGEMRDPQRSIPRSILLGVAIVIVVYVSANLAYIYVLGQPGIAASQRVAADTMKVLIGPVGGSLITLAILCSTFGAINANVLAGPRIFFAMARDELFFRQVAEIHPRFQTPANAISLLSVWAAILTLTGGYEHLITMSMFAAWILFAMAVGSVIVLRRKHPEWPRPYRVPGYPATALVFVVVAVAFVIVTLFDSPRSSLFGLVLVLAGIPAYWKWRKKDVA